MRTRFHTLVFIGLVVATAAGCAASKAFSRGDRAMKAGDLDQAVAYYQAAS